MRGIIAFACPALLAVTAVTATAAPPLVLRLPSLPPLVLRWHAEARPRAHACWIGTKPCRDWSISRAAPCLIDAQACHGRPRLRPL